MLTRRHLSTAAPCSRLCLKDVIRHMSARTAVAHHMALCTRLETWMVAELCRRRRPVEPRFLFLALVVFSWSARMEGLQDQLMELAAKNIELTDSRRLKRVQRHQLHSKCRRLPYASARCPGIVVLPAGVLISLTFVVFSGISWTIRPKVLGFSLVSPI